MRRSNAGSRFTLAACRELLPILSLACVAIQPPHTLLAQGAADPETECDRLAANPTDAEKVGAGVSFDQIDASRGVIACRAAVARHPGVRRFEYQLGRALLRGGQHDEGLTLSNRLFASGYMAAGYSVGHYYYWMARDHERAFSVYRQMADRGDATAQLQVGYMYDLGEGVPQNDEEAAAWYRRAAAQGNVEAQHNLGFKYQHGRGVPQSYELAAEWYLKAAESGFTDSQGALGALYVLGRGVAQDYPRAHRLLLPAAAAGDPYAQNNLGYLYEWGLGVSRDNAQAAVWYEKAAEQGLPVAQSSLAQLYYEGRGVGQSDEYAVAWFSKAAEQGVAHAQFRLGRMYATGRGLPQSNREAVGWYARAAEQGHAPAQTALGMAYTEGQGVSVNAAIGDRWLASAARQGNTTARLFRGLQLAYGEPSNDPHQVIDDLEAVMMTSEDPEVQGMAKRLAQMARRTVVEQRSAQQQRARSEIGYGEALLGLLLLSALMGSSDASTGAVPSSSSVDEDIRKAREAARRAADQGFEAHPGAGY